MSSIVLPPALLQSPRGHVMRQSQMVRGEREHARAHAQLHSVLWDGEAVADCYCSTLIWLAPPQ